MQMNISNKIRKNYYRILPYFQISPSALYLIIFMVAPLLVFTIYSFWRVESFKIIKDFNLENYIKIFTSKLYLKTFLNSVYIGFIASFFVVVIGYILSYGVKFFFGKYKNLWMLLIYLSIFGSYLVRIYAWKSILGVSGLINQILLSLRIVEQPLTIFMYNRVAVIITLINLYIPYSFVTIFSSLQEVSKDYIEASRDLGGNSLITFFKITFPLSFNGVITGFIVTFVFSSTDFVVPSLLGGKTGLTVSKIIAEQFGIVYNWPFAAALSIVFIVMLLIILMVISSLPKLIKRA